MPLTELKRGLSSLIFLAKAFQTTSKLWLNLQQKYDLWNAAQESEILNKISPINLQAC
jgi:plasmid maintenance system antidote protein VapI